MDPHIPPVLIPIFDSYLSLIHQRLPGFLSSFCVVGSIALGEFNPYFSDVDFVAGMHLPARENEIQSLKEIHEEVERRRPRWKLEGMYQLESTSGGPDKCLAYHDGLLKIQPPEPDPVTGWILKNHGIALLGPNPRALPVTLDAGVLVTWTVQNMNTYWRSWTRRPGRLIRLLTDWGIQWSALGVARQFYTIRENGVISKRRAGEYALSIVPPRWHRILHEAIRIRSRSGAPLYRSRLSRMIAAVNFMKYIMQVSNSSEG